MRLQRRSLTLLLSHIQRTFSSCRQHLLVASRLKQQVRSI